MSIRILTTELYVLNMRTRMPFRYGIATLTALPHLFVRAQVDIDGQQQFGLAADGLPPKWFTKDPDTSFEDDLDEMLHVIRSACTFAEDVGSAESVFALWQRIYHAQERWAAAEDLPPLLWNFGVSLVERALIDAFCRAADMTFAHAVRLNALHADLGAIHPALADTAPADWLPAQPLRSLTVRHTVGLGDPLTDADIPGPERLEDGLPQSLATSIAAYDLTHFKIKVQGEVETDVARLRAIADLFDTLDVADYAFTLDGNEQYRSVAAFRDFWQALHEDSALESFLRHLLFVEQPLHREVALSEPVGAALRNWSERPPIIIDESDGALESLPTALARGYQGTSHKNCKGVFKGIANACLIARRNREQPGARFVISGEDLANVGPVALLQDLAVLATLGIEHAERNGHHYFAGLRMLPRAVQTQMLSEHGDLYRMHDDQFATLAIEEGRIEIDSVVDAPFGLRVHLDPSQFTPLDQWQSTSLFQEIL